MIYLVSRNQELFKSDKYETISITQSIDKINSWNQVQFDTETSGKDAHLCKLLSAQFGNDEKDERIVIDCTTIDFHVYKEILESKLLIGQNLKFDLQFLYNYGITPTNVYDTMIIEQLLHLGWPNDAISYSLKEIAWRYLKVDIDKSIRGQIIWRGLDEEVVVYGAGDVTYLEKIKKLQEEKIEKQHLAPAAKIENRFVPVIAYLEWCGIKLDIPKWKEKMKQDKKELEVAENNLNKWLLDWYHSHNGTNSYVYLHKEGYPEEEDTNIQYLRMDGNNPIYEFDTKVKLADKKGNPYITTNIEYNLFSSNSDVGKEKCNINWSSSEQVLIIAKILGFNTQVKDKKTGKTKDSVLEKQLKGQKGICDDFLKNYFKYQECSKVVSTFGDTHLNAVNPITGRIHTTYKQLGAASGRMSCGSQQPNTDLAKYKKLKPSQCIYPNIQQLPSNEITRSCFISEPGNLFCSCDYSALESRLGADIYQEPNMLDEYLHGTGDLHSVVAKACFPKELADIDIKDIKKLRPDLRKRAKPVEFSQQFGGSPHAIASSLGCSMDEANEIAEGYWSTFKGIANFKERGTYLVEHYGYVLMCKYTGIKMYWYGWDKWRERQDEHTPDFWQEYREIHKPNKDYVYEQVREDTKIASKWSRMALNGPTQGTGAEILKTAMILFYNWILKNNYFNKVKLVALVHDEACIDYPKDIDAASKLKECMEKASAFLCRSLPIPADPEVSTHWVH